MPWSLPAAPFLPGSLPPFQVLRNKVDDALVLTSDDFPAAVVKQRLGDKASIQALVEEVRAG